MKRVSLGKCPNIVNTIGCCTLQEPIALVMEYVPYGNLLGYLRTSRKLRYVSCVCGYVHTHSTCITLVVFASLFVSLRTCALFLCRVCVTYIYVCVLHVRTIIVCVCVYVCVCVCVCVCVLACPDIQCTCVHMHTCSKTEHVSTYSTCAHACL